MLSYVSLFQFLDANSAPTNAPPLGTRAVQFLIQRSVDAAQTHHKCRVDAPVNKSSYMQVSTMQVKMLRWLPLEHGATFSGVVEINSPVFVFCHPSFAIL
jgi:hypothetical protein